MEPVGTPERASEIDRITLVGLVFETASGLHRTVGPPLERQCELAGQDFEILIRLTRTPGGRLTRFLSWGPFVYIGQCSLLQQVCFWAGFANIILGVFNLLADGGKLLFKQDPLPGHVNKFYFMIAPGIALIPAFTTVVVVPFGAYLDQAGQVVPLMLANVDVGLLAVFAIASLGIVPTMRHADYIGSTKQLLDRTTAS